VDLRFVTWNVRFVSVSASLKAVTTELAKQRSGSVGVLDVRWDKGGIECGFVSLPWVR
jgi:hypothetical protein